MRKILFLSFIFLFICVNSFADRVCIEKSTGKVIEIQGGNAPLGTLTQNAINSGYNANNLEEKYQTPEEIKTIIYKQIIKPAQDKKAIEDMQRAERISAIKTKLNITEDEAQLILK